MPRPRSPFATCTADGCAEPHYAKGLCRRHYVMQRNYGRTQAERERRSPERICSVDECGKPVRSRGLCNNHYAMWHKYGRTERQTPKGKRSHPLYHLWFDRKRAGVLCDEWLDLFVFADGVGSPPEGPHFLVPLDGARKLGPDNFKWQPHLKRQSDESRKAWWARKWAARQTANPGMERERTYRRRYGITSEQYAAMYEAQNGVCATCGKAETTVDPKTGSLRRLAVDHHHGTGKVRGLLCFRCNSTIGKVEENPDLLQALADYLRAHADDRRASP